MNRVDGMEALDAVENGMIKLGQNRDIWQNDVVYAALAGVRLLLLDALKERPEPPETGNLVRVVRGRVCQYSDHSEPDGDGYGICELTGADIAPIDFCSRGEEAPR